VCDLALKEPHAVSTSVVHFKKGNTVDHPGHQKRVEKLMQGPLPFYYQVAGLLRNEILSGAWPPESRLPTEEELVKRYGVSRPTIRKAKRMLAEQGFIQDIKGSGCYLNSQETWNTMPPTVDNLNDIFHFGSQMSFKIHEYGMVSNSKEIRSRLVGHQDRFVFQIKGVRQYLGQPISSVIYYLPFRFASRIPLESLDENPFIPQIEKLAGIQVVEGIQTISLGRADEAAADQLGLEKGAAVLLVESVYFDSDRQPIEYVRSQYANKLPYAIRVRRNSVSSLGPARTGKKSSAN
jgi:GntR family transcriptional regulator